VEDNACRVWQRRASSGDSARLMALQGVVGANERGSRNAEGPVSSVTFYKGCMLVYS
jgi:hypothetical protein